MRTWRKFALSAALVTLVAALVAVPAYSAANTLVQGRGSTTQFLCPSGLTTFATIDFSAFKNKGNVSGFFQIFGGANKSGSISGGTMNQNQYSLTAIVSPFAECLGSPTTLPATATISGACGVGVIIHYRDSHGEVGDFIGNVACS